MLLIICLLIISANAKIVPLKKIKVGDIVNIKNLSYESIEILDDIFNGFDATKFIETENNEDIFSFNRRKDLCMNLESFMNYRYAPTLFVDDIKLKLSSKVNNFTTIKYYNTDIDPSDISDNYFFSIVKVCLLKSKKYLNVNLVNEFNFSMANDGLTPLIIFNMTSILKYRKNNETSYVSSIFTGECFYQVFWHTKGMCRDFLEKNSPPTANYSFFESYVYKSQIFTENGNFTLENQINHQAQKISLTDDLEWFFEERENVFDNINKKNVVRIEFRSLPNPPVRPNREMLSKNVSLDDLKVGDVINIDAENVQYHFNIHGTTQKYEEPPSMVQEYGHCYENEVETLTPKKSYSRDPDHSENYYKFSLFHQMIKSYNYGVDKLYLNDNYKCLKLTLCSRLKGQKSNSPNLKMIDLEKFSSDNQYNFFKNENVVMLSGNNYSTFYHVKGVESGECLFQALIYPASASRYDVEYFHELPVQRGRIMSASGNHNLENRIKIFLAFDPLNIFESLFTAKLNILNVTLPIFDIFRNSALINLYLDHI